MPGPLLTPYYGRPLLFNLMQTSRPGAEVMFDPKLFGGGLAQRARNIAIARGMPMQPAKVTRLSRTARTKARSLAAFREARLERRGIGQKATQTRMEQIFGGTRTPFGFVGRYGGEVKGLF